MANSSFKKETTSPEKQKTLHTSIAITQAVRVGKSTTRPPAKPATGWSYVTPLTAKPVVPNQVAIRGSSSAPPTKRRTATGSSSTTRSKQYATRGRSTRARANVARASVVQMVGNCGGIVSAVEQGNAAARKLKKRRKPAQMVVPEGVIPTCCVCFHSFKSWKGLFGHMRCHPDRQWRGCFPPPIEEQLDAALNAANPHGIVVQGGEQDPILGDIDLNVPLLEEDEDDDDNDEEENSDADFDLNLPPNDSTGGGAN